ncbi:MAG: porin family protein [Rubrivivax sp.]
MKKQQRIIRSTLAALLVAGGVAGAQAEGLYVGGALGTPDYHSTINGISGSGSGLGARGFVGWQFNPYFGLEGGLYSLGRIDNASGELRTRGAYIDAVGTLPLATNWSLLGSAGLTQAKLKTSFGDDSTPGLKLGVGVQYDLTPRVALRAQYERYRFTNAFDDKANAGATTFGVKVGF